LVAVAAFVFLGIPILMLIAIPTIGSLKKQANETSAMHSVQIIAKAQMQYSNIFPANGYSCSLQALGGDPASGAPTPTSAQILQNDLASGIKSGYQFTIGNCTKVNLSGTDRITGYQVTAVPLTVGKTGNRGFCSDESGTMKQDPAGGTNCTQQVGQ
jgi:type IV pilus assembly protein PilA